MSDIVDELRYGHEAATLWHVTKEAADTIEALRAENARLTKERDNALHRAAEYRDECNSLTNQNRALRAARAAMGETE